MSKKFNFKHPDIKLKGSAFIGVPSNWNNYSMSCFMNQSQKKRLVGSRELLMSYDYEIVKKQMSEINNKSELYFPALSENESKNRDYSPRYNDVSTYSENALLYTLLGREIVCNNFDNIDIEIIEYTNNTVGTAEAGTALGNFNIETSPAVSPFVSKTLKRKNDSYSFAPGQSLNTNTPTFIRGICKLLHRHGIAVDADAWIYVVARH